ncbi:hypothetical protein [Aliiroseovarius sp. 2305UL8-7]|uniref:hypothetical protein n=1 Tax=Aliiroseovarius conchicola TaxID=3121637 RepID=UPI003528D1A6
MKHHILAFGMITGAVLFSVQNAHAERLNCAPRNALIERLAEAYGETRRSIGLAANNTMVEVFASSESGTWTITVTTPQGITCLVANGRSFETLNEVPTPAMLGKPV